MRRLTDEVVLDCVERALISTRVLPQGPHHPRHAGRVQQLPRRRRDEVPGDRTGQAQPHAAVWERRRVGGAEEKPAHAEMHVH